MNKIESSIKMKSEAYSLSDIDVFEDRPEILRGSTYKLKPADHAFYITINNIERNGKWYPYEIFINTKDTVNYQWIMIFCRLVSALFKRSEDHLFIVEEMKAVVDPGGGYFAKGQGRVQSLVAGIGQIIETHILQLRWETSDEI